MGRSKIQAGVAVAVLLAGGGAAVGWRSSAVVPLGPDRPELARFTEPPSRPDVELKVTPLRTGSQTAPRCAAAGAASCLDTYESVHAAYLVEHPHGTFLIEAATSAHAEEDVERFPFPSNVTLRFDVESNLSKRLAALGSPELDFVLVTHGHWDHTSGLRDLRSPRVILGPGELEYVRTFAGAPHPSAMPEHLDGAKVETFAWDGPPYENFDESHDLFGDGSVVLVPLRGHTPGSLGIFLENVRGRRLLFVGDAAWVSDAFAIPSHRLEPFCRIVDHDPGQLSDTLWRLHHLQQTRPELLIVPTHDGAAHAAVAGLKGSPLQSRVRER
jgi:glyoxylase-like metal-dependent hydrolase (beta-lactamase superfamily II)